MAKLLIGTKNPGKLSEIKTILGNVYYELESLATFDKIETPAEEAPSYAENAILKAKSYATQTGLLTLADDSGLEVQALNGAPGVLSARYAGEGASDETRRSLLLAELTRMGSVDRRARFVCAVAIAHPNQTIINVAEAVCHGRITEVARGSGGFGYDPLFIPDGFDLTFAELEDYVKNQISHRGLALAQTRSFLLGHKS
ncbi:MAG TPA: RdgB/HAM1 family non-canonical purine NTP pyrophosphatase [Pyrinomonadaceae bacterium]